MKDKPTWEELISAGMEIREAKDNTQWKLGDLSILVVSAYGTDSLGKFATEVGLARSTIYQYRKVSETFPSDTRIPRLSHRHHTKASNSDDPIKWIEMADANNWSSERLAVEISKTKGKEITKTIRYQVCNECYLPIYHEVEFCKCEDKAQSEDRAQAS